MTINRNPKHITINRRRISIFFLVLTFLLLMTTSCDKREEGKKLAETGISTSEKLAEYYDSLAQDAVDIMEFESYLAVVRDTPISGGARDDMEKTIIALRARARMARRLGATYGSLKDLTSYDAGGAVKESATNLADAIKGLPGLPGSAVIPSEIIGMVAEDITRWKQSKDIKRGVTLLLLTLDKTKELMTKELGAYESIAEERRNKAGNLIELLIQDEKVTSLSLLQKVPNALNLKLIDADKPVKEPNRKLALIAVAKMQFYRQSIASVSAGSASISTLESLIDSHRNFGKERGSGISRIAAGIERIQVYLDEIKKLREAAQENDPN